MITALSGFIYLSSCLASGIAAGLGYRIVKERFFDAKEANQA